MQLSVDCLGSGSLMIVYFEKSFSEKGEFYVAAVRICLITTLPSPMPQGGGVEARQGDGSNVALLKS